MKEVSHKFGSGTTRYLFSATFNVLKKIVAKKDCVIITDENVFAAHSDKFKGWRVVVIPAGEEYKTQATCDSVIDQLVRDGVNRTTTLVGAGGGMITDVTGYVASIYMRGLNFGFIPTTLLAMVDAAIGGKNGVDHHLYKNLVGVIRQPSFILYDVSLLNTLPTEEWSNGFAEVIKHACIRDATMFRELERGSITTYVDQKKLSSLIIRNASIKISIVKKDEFEKGPRKLLNFGHTLGHALEKQYNLSHGQAIAIGMAYASKLSERLTGFKHSTLR